MLFRRFLCAGLLLLLLQVRGGAAEPSGEAESDGAKLPRVLLLGDSISLGYTPVVAKLLEGQAEVRRPNVNCQFTDYGLKNLKTWLGNEPWDVIHFNWGIWDTHYIYEKGGKIVPYGVDITEPGIRLRNSREQYAANLEKLIEQMKASGATLVFATTTPCLEAGDIRFENIALYNQAAVELMDRRQILVNDLYVFALPNCAQWQQGDKCHFNAPGNEKLGERVAASILSALKKRDKAAK